MWRPCALYAYQLCIEAIRLVGSNFMRAVYTDFGGVEIVPILFSEMIRIDVIAGIVCVGTVYLLCISSKSRRSIAAVS